jgi:hypothetical protein
MESAVINFILVELSVFGNRFIALSAEMQKVIFLEIVYAHVKKKRSCALFQAPNV